MRNQCAEEKQKYEALIKEQDSISTIFTEERERRDAEEETLRKKLKVCCCDTCPQFFFFVEMIKIYDCYLFTYIQEAEITTKDLMEKVKKLQLEKMEAIKTSLLSNGASRGNV